MRAGNGKQGIKFAWPNMQKHALYNFSVIQGHQHAEHFSYNM